MPISLPPLSRRQFLAGSLATVTAAATARFSWAAESTPDANRFALFADTHVSGDRQTVVRDTNMCNNFVQATREVLQCQARPTALLVGGDCAYLEGKAEDYRVLHELVAPARQEGLSVHFALGNHDHRERFWEIVEEGHPQPSPVVERHVAIVESPHARWFLLDSLDQTNQTPGVLGTPQLQWLATALDQHSDKPALVMLHHNPDKSEKPTGLVETRQLLDLLTARSHVKMLVFGHSHHWSLGREKQVHLVNLPPVAYLFQTGDPNGWVEAQLNAKGVDLTMHCIAPDHPLNGQRFPLVWEL